MTKKITEQSTIFYPRGCYGTFFEWIFNFFENPKMDVPFSDNGNSHKFLTGNFFEPKEKLFSHIESGNKYKFSRVHPGLFEKINEHEYPFTDTYDNVIQRDLDFLKSNFDRVLAITYDESSILWFENNGLHKTFLTEDLYNRHYKPYGYSLERCKEIMTKDPTQRFRHLIDYEVNSKLSPLRLSNLQGWGKDSIYDFDIWDLRELMSFYWFTRNQGQLQAWNIVKKNPANHNVMFVTLDDLKNNFKETVLNAAEFCNANITQESCGQLDSVHQQWLALQKYIDRDALCNEIVESITNNSAFDWSMHELSLIDEAFIQKKLNDNNIEIKCHNLNVFPTNSQEFQNLLIRK